jgi:predicted nucleic acid-binding protein
MKKLTVDSSVIISSLLAKEPRNKEARKIWESVLSGKNLAILPYSVLVEVTAAVRRRTGSKQLALQVKEELLGIEAVSFVVLDDRSADGAAKIAAETGVRGMDALVIQVSREFGTQLITFDDEIIKKVQGLLNSD